jgi:hypothetical protein
MWRRRPRLRLYQLPKEPLAKVSIPLGFHQTIPGNLVAQAFQPVLKKD